MSEPPTETVWLTPEEVAERFRISLATVYRALREDRMPGIKILNVWRIDSAELDQWIASQRPMPRPMKPREEFMAEVRAIRQDGDHAAVA